MGLAKVLLGHLSKEAGLSKCARVDSVGLAKRRLAAKAAQEDREELIIVEPDPDEVDAAAAEAAAVGGGVPLSGQDPLGLDDLDHGQAAFTGLENRELRDSIRIHRLRFRQRRASVDVVSSLSQDGDVVKRLSSGSTGSPPTHNAHVRQNGASASGCEDATLHVRFRRASDGEYLTRTSNKIADNGRRNTLKAVQLKAERLFKRLTGNFVEPPRPRSVTPSRAASPPLITTSQRAGGHASRSGSVWAALTRRHTSDVDGGDDNDEGTPPDRGGRAVPSFTGRRKRQSAPGELFLVAATAAAAAGSTSPPVRSPASPNSREGITSASGKGRNWLARISRGFSATAAGGGGWGHHHRPQPPGGASAAATVADLVEAPTSPRVVPSPSAAATSVAAVAGASSGVEDGGGGRDSGIGIVGEGLQSPEVEKDDGGAAAAAGIVSAATATAAAAAAAGADAGGGVTESRISAPARELA